MTPSATLWLRVMRAAGAQALKQTMTYYAAFIALGLTTASLGPTLPGLAQQTRSELSQISFLFMARALGYLFGSFGGGRLYDRLPGHRTMTGALFMLTVLLALVPTIPRLWLLTAVLLLVGLMEGIVDVGGNTLIVWVHRERVGPYMNGLHFFYGLGAFLAPIVIAQAILMTGSFGWGYWVLALLLLPVALRLLPLPNPAPILARTQHTPARANLFLLTLFVIFFLLYSGAEHSFGGWIYTYTLETGLANATTAAYVNAAFWGAFTLARLFSIPLAIRIRPRIIVLVDLLISLVGLSILLIFSGSLAALWVGTILVGLGMASGFPTMLTFAGRHMTITGQMTGWFFVGASVGGMILPWLIGQLLKPLGPSVAIWSILLAVGLGVFGMVLLRLRRPS